MNSPQPPPPTLPAIALDVQARLEACKRPLITSHVRLDGDALGAEFALAQILRERGASPHIVNDGPPPAIYRWLPGVEDIGNSSSALRTDYDLGVLLDVSSWERTGAICDALPPGLPHLGIDHHPFVGAAEEEHIWIDPTMSSVGEMVFRLARGAGWTISPTTATCLYVAIVTDTGRFTYSNARPATFRAAAELIELGADHVAINEHIYQNDPSELVALRAEVQRSLKRYADGRIGVMKLTQDMLDKSGMDALDTQDMASLPRAIAGVLAGVLLTQMEDGMIKASLRSRHGLNIEPVARQFGGGGHHAAAGCRIEGEIDDVERKVVDALKQRLAESAAELSEG